MVFECLHGYPLRAGQLSRESLKRLVLEILISIGYGPHVVFLGPEAQGWTVILGLVSSVSAFEASVNGHDTYLVNF